MVVLYLLLSCYFSLNFVFLLPYLHIHFQALVGTGMSVGGAISQLAFSSNDGLTVHVEELLTVIGGQLWTLTGRRRRCVYLNFFIHICIQPTHYGTC